MSTHFLIEGLTQAPIESPQYKERAEEFLLQSFLLLASAHNAWGAGRSCYRGHVMGGCWLSAGSVKPLFESFREQLLEKLYFLDREALFKGKWINLLSPFLFSLLFCVYWGLQCQLCAQSGTSTSEALQSVPGSTEEQAAPCWRKCTGGKNNVLFCD